MLRRLNINNFLEWSQRYCVGFMLTAWAAALCTLTSCNLLQFTPQAIEQAKLPYKVAGAKDSVMMDLEKQLAQQGTRVVTIGQDYMVSIPSHLLFANDSPRLTWGSYALLNHVVCFLKQFRKIAIDVTSFNGPCVSAKRDRALTLARARAVSNYLWSQGIDSRFIFTQGLGSDKPICGVGKAGDESANSRVEITFRDAVA